MRGMMVLGAGVALFGTAAADAQAPGAPYPQPGRQVVPGTYHPPLPPAPRAPAVAPPFDRSAQLPPPRWGSRVDGRWWGGGNAPGGWAAYRRPQRGWRVPSYWAAPRFYVNDWRSYGLAQPQPGYGWSRYYDDAVLIDHRGVVSDYRSGLDWDALGDAYRDDVPMRYDGPPRDERVIVRRERGLGTPSRWVSPDGRTTITTSGGHGGAPVVIASDDAYGYGGGVTTVTIQTQPVVTTTTTETIEDRVTYTPRVYRKRVWHARSKIKLRRRG